MEIIRIGNVELSPGEAEKLYYSGEKYIVTFSRIYQIHYSQAQRRFYGQEIFRAMPGNNYARRGRFYAYDAKGVNWLLGYKFLNEEC